MLHMLGIALAWLRCLVSEHPALPPSWPHGAQGPTHQETMTKAMRSSNAYIAYNPEEVLTTNSNHNRDKGMRVFVESKL